MIIGKREKRIEKLAEFDRFRDVTSPSLRENQSFTMLSGGYVLFMNEKCVQIFNLVKWVFYFLPQPKLLDWTLFVIVT